jgi:TonB family protein
MHGIIRTPDGSVLSGVRLVSVDNRNISGVTDINGNFEIALPAGKHTLIADPPTLYNLHVVVKVTDGGLNPDNVEFVVDPGQVCCLMANGEPFPGPVSLPKPAYPAAARAIRAKGEVIVTVIIDSSGRVTSAKAENGHPLLRAAGEKAALGSRFEAARSELREARLIYLFIPDYEKDKENETLKRYSNPYRIEVIAIAVTLDTATQRTLSKQ